MARKLTKRQQDAFTQRPGEQNIEFIHRGIRTLKMSDLPELMHLRSSGDDGGQTESIKLYVEIKMVKWTRMLAFGTIFLGICTIVAAFIVAS